MGAGQGGGRGESPKSEKKKERERKDEGREGYEEKVMLDQGVETKKLVGGK